MLRTGHPRTSGKKRTRRPNGGERNRNKDEQDSRTKFAAHVPRWPAVKSPTVGLQRGKVHAPPPREEPAVMRKNRRWEISPMPLITHLNTEP